MNHTEGRARPAWVTSLAIHGVLVAVVAWWLVDRLEPAYAPPVPTPLNLAMFQAPALVESEPAPVEPPPVAEPPPLEPVVEPSPLPSPAPVSKPRPKPEPKVSPPKPHPVKVEQPPVELAPSEPAEVKPVVKAPLAPVQAPVAAMPPVPKSIVPATDPAVEDAYRARIRQAVDAHKIYPRLARRMGEEGRVVLAFVIEADGRLVGVRVVESSGSELLDEAALGAVREAAPFPAFPAGVERKRWEFTLPLSFSLGG